MALIGDVTGLTGCIAGIAYKNISRNLRIKRNLDAAAYLHGMDRPQATQEEKDIVRAKIAWDMKNKKGEICPPEMLDFFENGAGDYHARKQAEQYWAGCMFEQIFEDAGINTRKPVNLTRGHNYMADFYIKYGDKLYYWQVCKEQGLRLNDIPKTCPTCGFALKDIGEPCPVCGAPALLKVKKSNTQINKEIKEREEQSLEQIQKDTQKAVNRYVLRKAIFWTILICGIYAFWIFCVRG